MLSRLIKDVNWIWLVFMPKKGFGFGLYLRKVDLDLDCIYVRKKSVDLDLDCIYG